MTPNIQVRERKRPTPTSTAPELVSPFPVAATAQHRLLAALLSGEFVTPITAIMDLNVNIVSARVSELRRMGWPIRCRDVPHPNKARFPLDTLPSYFLDQHFLMWIGGSDGKGKHPSEYPFMEGRGKFAEWTKNDYLTDVRPGVK